MSTLNMPDQKAFETELQRRVNMWQSETVFPDDMLPQNFAEMAWACFQYNSAFDLRMTAEYYKQITEKAEDYTYLDISTIGLVCKKRNAAELGLSKDEYNEFQMAIEAMVRLFLQHSTEQQDVIQMEMMAEVGTVSANNIPLPTAQA